MLKKHRTTAENLARLEKNSRLSYMAGVLAQLYADAGRWHDPTEQERIRSIITDLRIGTAELHEEMKQDILHTADEHLSATLNSEVQHLREPNIRFSSTNVFA